MERQRLTNMTARVKTAAKKEDPAALSRELEGAPAYKPENVSIIIKALAYLSGAVSDIQQINNLLMNISSDEISPDGKLGGRGYVMAIADIKKTLTESLVHLSTVQDTISDELNNPGWELDADTLKKIRDVQNKMADETEEEIDEFAEGVVGEPSGADETEEEPGEGEPEVAPEEETEGDLSDQLDDLLGEGEEETPAEPEENEMEEGAPKEASSKNIFVGIDDNADSVTKKIASAVLLGLVKTANSK